MKLWLLAGVLAAIVLAASACAGSHRAPKPSAVVSPIAVKPGPVDIRTVSSSRLIQHRSVRCTATVTTPAAAGRALHVLFRVSNVTHHSVNVQLGYGSLWLVVKSPDGTTYDTRVPLRSILGPYIPPTKIPAGATKKLPYAYLRVRWSGPLRITPGCENTSLAPLAVKVTSPGAPASGDAAVAAVVAGAGHLLDNCRPTTPGVPVTGVIVAPKHSAPPMHARCSVSIERKRGFDVAQALIVTPAGWRGVHVREPYESISAPRVENRNTEVVAWQFVVTRSGATSVYSAEIETMKSGSGKSAPDWDWTSAGHGERPGGSRCGGSGSGGGGIAGPLVEFVSNCR